MFNLSRFSRISLAIVNSPRLAFFYSFVFPLFPGHKSRRIIEIDRADDGEQNRIGNEAVSARECDGLEADPEAEGKGPGDEKGESFPKRSPRQIAQ
jgi:hypothetical protein